jgi:hypothetical protein
MSVMNPIPMPVNEAPLQVAAIHPLRFYIKYMERKVRDEANPSIPKTVIVPVEWCDWAKKGVERPTTGGDAVARLMKSPPDWAALKPYYDNWKAGGTDIVVNGMPLTIWAGINAEVCELLRPYRIYSVEDLGAMSDSVMQKIPHPDIARIRDRAKKFLGTKELADAVRALDDRDDAIKQKDEAIATLQAQMKALMEANAITSQAATGAAPRARKRAETAA